MKIFLALVAIILCGTAASAGRAEEPAVKVMVLGTYHMANPGRDLHDAKVDDVTAPEKQRQLETLARELAQFRPTKIALEGVARTTDFTSEEYRRFTPAELKTNPDERAQIGYRLAYDLGLEDVYLIDEQSGAIDYFPYGEVRDFAEAHGMKAYLDALNADVEKMIGAFNASQKTKTVAQLLAGMNDPQEIEKENDDFYYGLLKVADQKSQPGAELNAYWYMRNAKIFSKLTQIAKPGDRVLVVFGAGHAYWLRHFAEHTPGFDLVEPDDYLR
ncbi:MAG: hypothetical protein GC153_00390 [Alphaproteobacteria bacterium]|nr:hypothetical protein [Alphaproteobacteria bacterium]